MKKFILFLAFVASIFTICISANEKISPAIDVIAAESNMIKAGVVYNGEITFDTDDFDLPLSISVNQITVCSLPPQDKGKLMLDNLHIVENQVILREDFSMLRFIPKENSYEECYFTFEPNNSGYEIECVLKPLSSVNFAPSCAEYNEIAVWTQKDISCFGVLNGYDPEKNDLKFEIISYPQKGLICITDCAHGDYVYTPYTTARGTDTFTYRVRDSYGNYSAECKVNVKIEKLRTSLVFKDMENSKYLNAALVVTEKNLLDYSTDTSGIPCFMPNETVSREEFLALLMKSMGAKNVPQLSKTRFADDSDISNEYKGYIEGAFVLGIISGDAKSDGLYFYPKNEITVAEAAVIINKIIGIKTDGSLQTFKDYDEIPAWAQEDIQKLCQIGILTKENGKINPNEAITREQAAQIIMSLLQYTGRLNK